MELLFLAILVILMAIALGSGYPVAFALPGSAIISILLAGLTGFLLEGNVDAYFHTGGALEWLSAGVTNLRGVYWEVERDTLIAIPLFIFMGIMLQRSKIAEDLLVTMAQLFGPVRGGLGISVVFVGALLAATTGIVGATVVAMGLISLPAMLRNKYSTPLATGTIAASGTLGQIIPPSIVLIILADQLSSASDQASTMRKSLYKESTGELTMPSVFDVISTSAGEMFLGAFVPGLLLVGIYMAFILIAAFFIPKIAPPVPYKGKMDKKFWVNVFLILIPPLTLIILVLGSIISGIATVNQAGAIGAAGAIVMAGYRQTSGSKSSYYPALIILIGLVLIGYAISQYDMNIKLINSFEDKIGIFLGLLGSGLVVISLIWSGKRLFNKENTMQEVMLETAKTTSLVFIILLGAAMLTAAFRAFGGEELVKDYLNSLPGGFWTKFVIVMAVIFVLGFFLEFIEIAVVVVPIVAPILLADPSANITAVWLGVMIGLNIQTSFLTPPFGFALFYLRGVASKAVKTLDMYKGVIPFIALQLLALAIVGIYPTLVNYLPNRVSYLSENSPPPRNPKLQICIEDFIKEKYLNGNNEIKNSIEVFKNEDFSSLDKKYSKIISSSLSGIDEAMVSLKQAYDINQEISEKSKDYLPILNKVRGIQRVNLALSKELEEKQVILDRIDENDTKSLKKINDEIQNVKLKINSNNKIIPNDWTSINKNFKKIVKLEQKKRNDYRRLADNSYEKLATFSLLLSSVDDFYKFKDNFIDLKSKLDQQDKLILSEQVKSLSKKISELPDNRKITSNLNKVRRELKKKKVKMEKVYKLFDKSYSEYLKKLKSLNKIDPSVLLNLNKFINSIKYNVGVRQQPKLNRDLALYAATCNADHKDLSIHF